MPVLSRRALIAGFASGVAATPALAVPTVATPSLATSGRMAREAGCWTGGVLVDGAGASFVLGDLRMPLAVLKLWAHWCPACLAEMPRFAAGTSAMQGVDVLLVSHPEYWDADQAAARRRNLPFRLATFATSTPAALVQGALTDWAGRFVVPRTLVFRRRDHAIVSEHEGAVDWSSTAVAGRMKGLPG